MAMLNNQMVVNAYIQEAWTLRCDHSFAALLRSIVQTKKKNAAGISDFRRLCTRECFHTIPDLLGRCKISFSNTNANTNASR